MFMKKEFVGGIGVRGIGEAGMRTRRKKRRRRRGRTRGTARRKVDGTVRIGKAKTVMRLMKRVEITISRTLRLMNFGMSGSTVGFTTTTMTAIFEHGKDGS
jgi:hypothetical protein